MMETMELAVDGMTCGSCVRSATRALTGVPGVKQVDVDLASGKAVVAGEQVREQLDAMLAALTAAGFAGRLAQAQPTPVERVRGGCGTRSGGCCCG